MTTVKLFDGTTASVKTMVSCVFNGYTHVEPNTNKKYLIPRFVVTTEAEYVPNRFKLPFYIHRTIDVLAGKIYQHETSFTITHAPTGLAAVFIAGSKKEALKILKCKLAQFKNGKEAFKHGMRNAYMHLGTDHHFQPADIGQDIKTIYGATLVDDAN